MHPDQLPAFTNLDLFLSADIFPDTLQLLEDVLSGRIPIAEQDGNACSLIACRENAVITFGWDDNAPEVRIKTAELKALVAQRLAGRTPTGG